MSSAAARLFSIARRRTVATATVASAAALTATAVGVETWADQFSDQQALPRHYNWDAIHDYWSIRPVTTVKRLLQVTYELSPILVMMIRDFYLFASKDSKTAVGRETAIAVCLREALTNLGPAFVKAGQQLSIRPDLVPPAVLKELQKLCDAVRPVPDEVALAVLREELKLDNLDTVFTDLKLVASASLGQVYKARLKHQQQTEDEYVAIKVQRPGMLQGFSLDLFLLQRISLIVDTFTSIFTNQPPFHKALYESFSRGSYAELDYEQEAAYQVQFQRELAARNCPVLVPHVYQELTTQRVLTTQWIDGIKLADAPEEQIRQLIPVGVELFLTQLLDMGTFHADPHPGNLLVHNGKLCLLDFGLCAQVDERSRNAMTKAIVHLLMRDFDTLVSEDAKELGFLPEDFDTEELKPILTKILTVGVVESGSNLQKRKKKLLEISNELNQVFFQYPFSVPPFFALITRGLGLLEGIALTGDPDFDIFQASAPYARRRAIQLLGSSALALRRLTQQKGY